MSEAIMRLYETSGVEAPNPGKGEHTMAFHKMAIALKKANPDWSMDRCYATAMAKLGRGKAVNKSHWSENNG